jgi:L-2-hydroxyglutarate oxidase LhgO
VFVGGGIVGLATARALLELHPGLAVTVLEKESTVGAHQTGHNSGVIHSGIYYRPGSLKAELCRDGAERMVRYCDERGIAHERCGKVIVATDEGELPALDRLLANGTANGVPGLRRIGPEELREYEPHAAGIAALHSPATAIVDFGQVAAAMAEELRAAGAQVLTGTAFRSATAARGGPGLRVRTTAGDLEARALVNCAGLYADEVARRMGLRPPVRIVPFRGEYHLVRPERRDLVRALIYPVPDPRFPFLGVHFTRTVHGEVEAGPNAVLAFAREGYTRWRVHPRELAGTLLYPGTLRLAKRFWRVGLDEYRRSLSAGGFASSLARLVPEIVPEDLIPGPAGVRAQAVAPDGSLVDDFRIVAAGPSIHVLNAPSPAATASLAIGEHIARMIGERVDLEGGQR